MKAKTQPHGDVFVEKIYQIYFAYGRDFNEDEFCYLAYYRR